MFPITQCTSLWQIMTSLGHAQYGPQGHGVQVLKKGLLNILLPIGLMVSEKKAFVCFSHCKYMGANDPQSGANFDQGHDWQDLCRVPLNIVTC